MKQGYHALFWICLAYIAVFSLTSLSKQLWLTVVIELGALVLALVVSRRLLPCRAAEADYDLGFSPRPLLWSLPFLPFFVGGVVGVSFLTALVCSRLGIDTTFDYGDRFWVCLITTALIPAVTEEIFCRYLFLRYLLPHSRLGAVLASAVFFSLLHGNFYQIPYALFAGLFLGALAAATGSVLPGMLFHLVNNIASALLHFYRETALPQVLLWVLVGALVLGAVGIAVTARRLLPRLRVALSPAGCGRVLGGLFTSPLIIFLILFIGEAVIVLCRK